MKMIPARARIDAARRQRPGRLFRYIYIWEAHIWEADSRSDMTRI